MLRNVLMTLECIIVTYVEVFVIPLHGIFLEGLGTI